MGTKNTKMAFEGLLYYGTAGSTADTLIENAREKTFKLDKETGDTSVSGDGTGPSVNSSRVTALSCSIEWSMVNRADDTTLTALLTAAAAGTPVALRGKDYSSGKGPDMDFVLSVELGQPFKGEQTYKFSAEPTDEAERAPALANLYC